MHGLIGSKCFMVGDVVDGLVACSLGGVPGVELLGAVVVWGGVVRYWLVLVVGCVG